MHKRFVIVAAFIAAAMSILTATTRSLAGPPFVTDDPEPVELHHWEFYMGGTYEHTHDSDAALFPSFEFNYGLLPDTQVHIIASGAYNHEYGDDPHYGVADTELGVKYRFIHETDAIPQVAVFPLVELPTGNFDEGLGNGYTQVFIPVWLQKSFGKWTTYGGGGFWYNPGSDHRNYWRIGWELQRDLSEHFTLGAEIYHESSSAADTPSHTAFNIGGIYNFDEHHHLLLSVGRDMWGPTHFATYFAYQFTY